MSFIKKFESYMTAEEMKDHLCRCGYSMEELDMCSDEELRMMCNNQEESHTHDSLEESRKIREHQETQNYMFFGNLRTLKRQIDELLEMDEKTIDAILNEHDWASDHIATSKDDVEEVYNFLKGHNHPHHSEEDHSEIENEYETQDGGFDSDDSEFDAHTEEPEHSEEDELKNIKSFENFKY